MLESSALKKEEIYSVEIVGGSSRIPAIKTMIEEVRISVIIFYEFGFKNLNILFSRIRIFLFVFQAY